MFVELHEFLQLIPLKRNTVKTQQFFKQCRNRYTTYNTTEND